MPNNDKIKLFEIERPCEARFDLSQLSLQEVDRTTRHYSRKQLYLHDSDIVRTIRETDHNEVRYSLALLLRYRQEWVPKKYGLGELIYSLSLLPNEELTLEVKTWETAKTQTEEQENIENRNLSDVSSEQSDASEVLHDINTKENLDIDVSAEASFGYGSASASLGYSTEAQEQTKNLNTRLQKSAQQSINEMKRTHSLKMTVSRESGKEDKTTRKIKNINQTHTLNINYYQILKQYEVSLHLYEVRLILLGKEFDPVSMISQSYPLTEAASFGDGFEVGHRNGYNDGYNGRSQNPRPSWIQQFGTSYAAGYTHGYQQGYAKGSADRAAARTADPTPPPTPEPTTSERITGTRLPPGVLQYPTTSEMIQSLKEYSLDPVSPESFQNTVLKYVSPLPDVSTEPDFFGNFRYAFLINPGREQPLLEYLFGFHSGTIGNPQRIKIYKEGEKITIPAEGAFKIYSTHYLYRVDITNLQRAQEAISNTIREVLEALEESKEKIGLVTDSLWDAALPTHGIYAETMLGQCSGGEDYVEVNRQFDLELKKLEIERLKLELEKMRLVNNRISTDSRREIVISNPSEHTSVNLNLEVGSNTDSADTEIKFETEGP